MPNYDRSGTLRFNFAGMNSVQPPDAMPGSKYPLAINARAYLKDALTPRLPQGSNLLPGPLPNLVHSLHRMDDTTPQPIPVTPFGPDAAGTGTDVSFPGQVWSNPGNITIEDGNYATVSVSGSTTSAGPNGPTVASLSGLGNTWANPNNIFSQDGVYAVTTLFDGDASRNINGSTYGFAIPSTATITGIVLTAYVNKTGGPTTHLAIFGLQLTKAGVATGTTRGTGTLPAGVSTYTFGSSVDLWGTTWTPADINNAGFGFTLRAESVLNAGTVGVDFVSIQVFYTIPGTVSISDLLQGTSFGFAFPGGDIVSGFLVEIKGFQTGPGSLTVQMLKAGVLVGATKNITLPGANAFVSLGGSYDLWGATWLPADVNNANFGVSIQAANTGTASQFNIDFVRITAYGYPPGSFAGFVLIEGATDKVYVGNTQVASGMSGKRLAMVPFRPSTSVSPWMYIGDSNKLIKIRSDMTTYKTGIQEPQFPAVAADSGAGPITATGMIYAYKYRSSATGAVSNPSPTAFTSTYNPAAKNVLVTCTASADPQVDLIDVYRFGDVLDFTYVTTISNAAPTFIDTLSAVAIANNPLMQFDDFEPFPSIDTPKKGTCTIAAGVLSGTVNLTQTGGDTFNQRWLGGTIISVTPVGGGAAQPTNLILFARPTGANTLVAQIQPVGTALAPGAYNFTITQPILAAQPLPAFWGPTDNSAFMFACGDPLRPGTLYFTKGNNPDSAPDTNSLELTSPAEPLIGGCIVGGIALVLSGERGWLIYPNFAQATATIVGVVGSPFNTVPSISDRGLFTKEGICTDGGGNAYYIAKDSIRKSPMGTGSQSITDDDLYNLFPHEGNQQQIYVIAGISVYPPDYSQPDGMALRFSQGYVYFDYIGIDNNRYTLAFDTVNDAWSVDQYASVATIHADNPGAFISPGPDVPLGPLVGCVDGTVRQLSSTGNEANVNMTVLTPAYDAGDQRATKHFGDIYMETTTPIGVTGNFGLALWSDRYSTQQLAALSPATIPASAGIRVGSVLELNNGDGVYARDLGMVITCPINDVGSILHLAQPSTVLQPETIGMRATDWYGSDTPNAKFVQGLIIEADTANVPKQIVIQSGDDQSVVALAEVGSGIAFNGRMKIAFSTASPFIAHTYRLKSLDTVPWRVWSVDWVTVPCPELCQEWHTEAMSHGLKGYQHLGDMNIAHISTTDLILTLVPDQGPPQIVVIPNSSGQQIKTVVTIPAFKFKLVQYGFSSPQPFRLWKEDIEVGVKQWGDAGPYQILRPFGGESAPGAEV